MPWRPSSRAPLSLLVVLVATAVPSLLAGAPAAVFTPAGATPLAEPLEMLLLGAGLAAMARLARGMRALRA